MSKKLMIVLILLIVIFGLNSCHYISDSKLTNNSLFGNRTSIYDKNIGGVIFEVDRRTMFNS